MAVLRALLYAVTTTKLISLYELTSLRLADTFQQSAAQNTRPEERETIVDLLQVVKIKVHLS